MEDVAAVTGASGFIGSAVVRKLLERGRRVRCLVEPGARLENLDAIENADVERRLERVTCDVTDGPAMRRALEGAAVLYHLAAVYRTWLPEPEIIHRVNVEGTAATLLAARDVGMRRVVYTSSIAAVGLSRDPAELADETTPWNLWDVANPYILTKWQSERLALRFAEAGLPLVVVNPAFPFGPGDITPTPTGRILRAMLERKVPAALPGGICTIDVDDCAEGHVLAEERGRIGERYILGNDNVTMRELLELVGRVAGVPAPKLTVPASVASGIALGLELWADHVSHREPLATYRSMRYTQRRAFFSNAKARRELGLPSRPLEETVRRAVAWFRSR